MINISKSMYDQFCKEWNEGKYAGQRYGQAFYNHFNLHKSTFNLDPLYEADGDHAKNIIAAMIDYDQ